MSRARGRTLCTTYLDLLQFNSAYTTPALRLVEPIAHGHGESDVEVRQCAR
jgi:hypothetical protein